MDHSIQFLTCLNCKKLSVQCDKCFDKLGNNTHHLLQTATRIKADANWTCFKCKSKRRSFARKEK